MVFFLVNMIIWVTLLFSIIFGIILRYVTTKDEILNDPCILT